MKLQEMLQGPKPSSSSSRGARGSAAEGKQSDFAGALTEARKKPEPKPADAEAPVTKKSSAARKNKEAKDDAAPADETIATEQTGRQAETKPEVVDETPVADEATPIAEDDAEAPAKTDTAEIDPNLSNLAIAQATVPQLPVAPNVQSLEHDAELTEAPLQMICPPKLNQPAQPAAVAGEGESEALADAPAGLPETLLEAFGEVVDEESADPLSDDVDVDLDAALSGAPAQKATSKQPGAPVAPVDAAEAIKPESPKGKETTDAQAPVLASEFAVNADAAVVDDALSPTSNVPVDSSTSNASTLTGHVQPESAKPQAAAVPAAAPAPLPPQTHFVEANHSKIVTAVQTQALTNGGTMQIRLDPPELGALQVMVHMQDGVMTASFHTSNDDATKLLSHSLSQLKQVLESQGVSVERLQVSQTPKEQHARNDDPREQPRDAQDDAHRQEQQRKDMLRRMWRRLSNGSDPLDLVA